MFFFAISVIPRTAFMGVLISWDIEERNSVFAWFAFSASSAALRRLRFMYMMWVQFTAMIRAMAVQMMITIAQLLVPAVRSSAGIEPRMSSPVSELNSE